jgi:hypothetical protein
MEELFRSDFVIVTRETGFIRVRRTTVPMFPSLNSATAIEALVNEYRMKVPLRERKSLGVMLDTREAPMLLGDETMAPIRPLLVEVFTGYARHVVLVKTAVGRLQATRRAREEANLGRMLVTIFDDEAQAIAFLRGEELAAPPRSSKRS